MKKLILVTVIIGAALVMYHAPSAMGFSDTGGTCGGDCTQCHKLNIDQASEIIKSLNPAVTVKSVRLSSVGGLWEVVFEAKGQTGIAYLDFALKNLINGSIISIEGRSDITRQRLYDLNKIDLSAIPLDDALYMGNKDAVHKLIVFDDPD